MVTLSRPCKQAGGGRCAWRASPARRRSSRRDGLNRAPARATSPGARGAAVRRPSHTADHVVHRHRGGDRERRSTPHIHGHGRVVVAPERDTIGEKLASAAGCAGRLVVSAAPGAGRRPWRGAGRAPSRSRFAMMRAATAAERRVGRRRAEARGGSRWLESSVASWRPPCQRGPTMPGVTDIDEAASGEAKKPTTVRTRERRAHAGWPDRPQTDIARQKRRRPPRRRKRPSTRPPRSPGSGPRRAVAIWVQPRSSSSVAC